MRKFFTVALAAPFALAALGLVACASEEERANYRIVAEYFPERSMLSACMEARIPNKTENPLSALSFELYPNAYREGAKYAPVPEAYAPAAYYSGMSYGGVRILSVEGAADFSVGGEDENILSVSLGEALFPGERAELAIRFEVSLAAVDHRLGVGERTVNLTGFYPALCAYGESGFREYVYAQYGDPFVAECADFTLSLTVPEGYGAAYGGTGSAATRDGKTVYEISAPDSREIAVVLGTFSRERTEANGTEIEYCYLDDETPERTLEIAAESLAYFSETFGAYGHPRYTVVETDFPYGGMEFPMLSMISASLSAEELPAVVVHETAHQWWYSAVGSDQFEHAWQDEGLAEYSCALFFEAFPAYGVSYEKFVGESERAYRAFYSVSLQLFGADARMDKPLTEFTGAYEYRCVAYDKGVVLFDKVRMLTGKKKFLAALSRYCAENRGRIASPEDLIGCFSRTEASAEGLFASFTEGKCVL